MGVLLRTFHDVPVKPHIRLICSFPFHILFIDHTLDLGTYQGSVEPVQTPEPSPPLIHWV